MGVVDEPVEYRIGEATATEILVPIGDGQLRGDERGAGAVSLFDRFEQVLSFEFVEGGEAEVVDYQECEL